MANRNAPTETNKNLVAGTSAEAKQSIHNITTVNGVTLTSSNDSTMNSVNSEVNCDDCCYRTKVNSAVKVMKMCSNCDAMKTSKNYEKISVKGSIEKDAPNGQLGDKVSVDSANNCGANRTVQKTIVQNNDTDEDPYAELEFYLENVKVNIDFFYLLLIFTVY